MDRVAMARWIGIAAGVLLSAVILFGPNLISPGLGCFIAFLIGLATFVSERFAKNKRDFTRHATAATLALQEGYWSIAESNARQALTFAARLRVKRDESSLAAGVILTSALVAMRRWLEVCEATPQFLHIPASNAPKIATALASIHKTHAQSLLHLGRVQEAAEAARQCTHCARQGTQTAQFFQREVQADLCRQEGNYAGVLEHLKELEALIKASSDPALRNTLPNILLSQALAYLDIFRPGRAVELIEKALASSNSTSVSEGILISLKGQALDRLERGPEAEAAYLESLRIFEHHLPPDDSRRAIPHFLLAERHARLGNREAASTSLAAIEKFEPGFDEDQRRDLLYIRGLIALASDQPAEAQSFLLEALQKAEALTNPSHPGLAEYLEYLAIALERQGRMDEAAQQRVRWGAIQEAYAHVE